MTDHYVDDETYFRLVEALAALQPEIIGDRLALDPDQIKIALGEAGGIWPEIVREDSSNPTERLWTRNRSC